MAIPQIAGYGSWKSPISSSMVASGQVGFDRPIVLDGDSIYWLESRPNEGGRSVVVRWSPQAGTVDVTPPTFNVRTRVHEYGGGAFTVDSGTVYFSNFTDQRLYSQAPGSEPLPMTPATSLRYADAIIDRSRKRIICVREDHSGAGHEAVNRLVGIGLGSGNEVTQLVSGNDFCSSPRISPGGSRLAWLTWNHPHMPWDAAELWVGDIAPDGSVVRPIRVAGGYDQSVCHPRFSPDGTLYFVSEQTGWWNLYWWTDGRSQPLHPTAAEFGVPPWTFGASTYGFQSPGKVICTYAKQGRSFLASLDTVNLQLQGIEMPYTSIDSLQVSPEHAIFVAGSPKDAPSIVRYDLKTGNMQVLRRSADISVNARYISAPVAIEFPTANGLTAHAFHYPPKNPEFTPPPGERPPLLVISHGGPTSAASDTLSLRIQYWTSRGFAVADVNYGGSTGYGREYRKRLNGRWGIVDVDDCVNCALYLVEKGDADARRTIIRGGSAGGYTTLAALAFRDVFKAGASYYGVSDLEALVRDTHKFESRYLDSLVGPYPERRDIYQERSPINSARKLSCPVIFFQGSEDKIVPPNQAEMMVSALREKGVPVAYILFPGEQHGFRKSENIRRALDAELYFYSKVFGFSLADPVEPVKIDNLK